MFLGFQYDAASPRDSDSQLAKLIGTRVWAHALTAFCPIDPCVERGVRYPWKKMGRRCVKGPGWQRNGISVLGITQQQPTDPDRRMLRE